MRAEDHGRYDSGIRILLDPRARRFRFAGTVTCVEQHNSGPATETARHHVVGRVNDGNFHFMLTKPLLDRCRERPLGTAQDQG